MHDQCLDCKHRAKKKKTKPQNNVSSNGLYMLFIPLYKHSVCFRSWYLKPTTKKTTSGTAGTSNIAHTCICLCKWTNESLWNMRLSVLISKPIGHFWPPQCYQMSKFQWNIRSIHKKVQAFWPFCLRWKSGGEEPSNPKTPLFVVGLRAAVWFFHGNWPNYNISPT